jgi:hypothetical protein
MVRYQHFEELPVCWRRNNSLVSFGIHSRAQSYGSAVWVGSWLVLARAKAASLCLGSCSAPDESDEVTSAVAGEECRACSTDEPLASTVVVGEPGAMSWAGIRKLRQRLNVRINVTVKVTRGNQHVRNSSQQTGIGMRVDGGGAREAGLACAGVRVCKVVAMNTLCGYMRQRTGVSAKILRRPLRVPSSAQQITGRKGNFRAGASGIVDAFPSREKSDWENGSIGRSPTKFPLLCRNSATSPPGIGGAGCGRC